VVEVVLVVVGDAMVEVDELLVLVAMMVDDQVVSDICIDVSEVAKVRFAAGFAEFVGENVLD
jgi:hypothetical protein